MRAHIAVAMASVLTVACGQTGESALCNPNNCTGCCDARGECHTGRTSNNCGDHGDMCSVCAVSDHCSLGVCILGPGTGGGGGGTTATGGGGASAGGGNGGGFGGSGGFGGTGGTGGTGGGLSSGGGTGGGFVPHNDAGFPAMHPAYPTIINLGGPVLQTPKVMSITFANDDPVIVAAIDDFAATIGTLDYWPTTTKEYGVGPLTVVPAVHVNESPSGIVLDTDVDAWLAAHLTGPNPVLGAPDPNIVYLITYPTSVTINAGGLSCVAFGAYHYVTSVAGNPIVYAVLPRCTTIVPSGSLADNLTVAASHELIEAVTDPNAVLPAWGAVDEDHEAWNMAIYGEVGDLCTFDSDSFFRPTGYSHLVQRIYSNAAAAEGGHPCVPRGDPYFGAVPVLDDAVPFDFISYAVTGITDGAHIPLGTSKTIDVDLFSEAPGDLIFVSAFSYPATSTLDFTFPQGTTGYNGDVVKMRIEHLTDDPQLGGATFVLMAGSGNTTHYYFGFVGD